MRHILLVAFNNSESSSSNSTSYQTTSQAHQVNASFSHGVLTVNGVRYEMVKVNAGTFTMGATSEQQNPYDNEKPAHQVTLTNNYYTGKTEVTQALWKAVMGDNPSDFKGDNKPVECVSWDDCQTFISKLNAATGKNFRLPTEAEWEFAARGGNNSKHYKYSGSDNIDDVAWYDGNSSNTTHEVASKQANELGIYDMSGNVWEWCSDWHGDYSSPSQTNPTGANSGSFRVLRGGRWDSDARSCRSSSRSNFNPDFRNPGIGLRLALASRSFLLFLS
jgi:formylglycine-generating enzyme required for sulfatase activity